MDMGPDLRTQVDYVFALRENIIRHRKTKMSRLLVIPGLRQVYVKVLTDNLIGSVVRTAPKSWIGDHHRA